MRTTITISDHLLELVRERARARGTTVSQVIEEAVQHELHRPPVREPAPVLPVFTGGSGPRPGIDLSTNRSLLAALDDEATLDQLR